MPFATGLRTLDSSATRISNSDIFASSLGIQNEDYGFTVLSASNLEVDAGINPGTGINAIGISFIRIENNSMVTVLGGDNSVGIRLANSGPLPTLIDQSVVNVKGGTNTFGIDYLGSGGLSLQNGLINVTGAANSSGVQIASSSSGAISLVNSPVTVDLGSAGGGTGINILTGNPSRVTVEGSAINVLGGENTVGLNHSGNGSTSLSNESVVRVTGGADSRGIVSLSPSLMTIQDSVVEITGGMNTFGIDYLGSGGLSLQNGSINVTGAANSSGVQIAGSSSGAISLVNSSITVDLGSAGGGTGINILTGSPSRVTVEGCTINVLGGENTVGLNHSGNGSTSLSNESVVRVTGGADSRGIINLSPSLMTIQDIAVEITGGMNTFGIDYLGSGGLSLQNGLINVMGAANSSGVQIAGSSSGTISSVNSSITVDLGSAGGGTGINILTGSPSRVTVEGSAINVLGGENTVGLNHSGNGSTSLSNESVARVTGGADSSGIINLSPSLMTIQDSAVEITGGMNTFGIDYLGSGGLSLQNGSINVTGAANSSGMQIAGSRISAISLVNSSVTVDLGGAGGGTGINILAGNFNSVAVEGCTINVLGGENTIGLNNSSNGGTSLTDESVVRVTGGADSRGIVSLSPFLMEIQDSVVEITGGTNAFGIEYLGSGGLIFHNGLITVTGAANSSGVQIASSSSGAISLVNSTVTVDLGSAGGGTGINILTGNPSRVTVEGCKINVLGGENTVGLNHSGNGGTSLSNASVVNVTGGNNSIGIRDSSTTLMTMDSSFINVTGGSDTSGTEYVGTGSMDLEGVTLHVVGGDNATGFKYSTGTGTINIIRSTLNVNAENSSGAIGVSLAPRDDSEVKINESRVEVSGGEVTSGIILRGDVIFVGDNNAISVSGKTGFTYGLKAFNQSRGNDTNSKIVVLQSGNGIPIGMAIQDTSIVTNTTVDLYVGANHNTQAIGVLAVTAVTDSFIEFNELCHITVSGNENSLIASGSGNVLFGSSSVCTLNGAYVFC